MPRPSSYPQILLKTPKNLALLFTFSLVFTSFGQASAYEAVPVADGAVITGKVVFKGKAPEPKKLLIMKDEGVCGEGYIERKEIDVGNDGALKDVVVFLEGVKKGKAWEEPAEAYVLDQKGCEFRPYLQIIPRAPNSQSSIAIPSSTTSTPTS